MTKDSGALSIDFIAGFTIFLIAFIWVVSLVPGLLVNLQGFTIDYDAVAYRTGVILVEDPGWPSESTSPWESQIDKNFIDRFGLAISRDTPNILLQEKVDRFFCTTDFVYPEDYQQKAIFGDYPYGFNISLRDVERNVSQSTGDGLPGGYGYIRRLVKIKGVSNATINVTSMPVAFTNPVQDKNVTSHKFSILINTPQLYKDMTDLSYQIDPASDQIIINITNLNSTMTNKSSIITLSDITVTGNTINPLRYSQIPYTQLSLDDKPVYLANKLPQRVNDSISLKFSPSYFREQVYPGLYDKSFYKPIYINLSFTLESNSTFLNNSWSYPFDYNYDPANVTQPKLRDAVLEVAVWSGAITTSGGSAGPQPPIAAFSGTPLSGTAPLNVQFTDTSSGGVPNSWKWEFNKTIGGSWTTFSTAQNPSNPFSAGTYDIRLTAANGYGSSNKTIAGYITVPYTITATAGAGGTITPSGAVSVAEGASQTFAIAPNTNYHITTVLVNGSNVGAVTSYTFNNVVKDHTISASFAINTHVITVNYINPSRGSVTTSPPAIPVAVPDGGTVTVNESSSQTFYFKANAPNRVVTSITDNGVPVYTGPSGQGATITYTVPNVVAPHTLVVVFT